MKIQIKTNQYSNQEHRITKKMRSSQLKPTFL